MWVLPVMTPSWRRNVATSGPSRSQGSAGSRRLDPAKQGYPAAATRSLIETGNPWRGPTVTPAAKAASAAAAAGAGLLRRPKRIGVQALAKALVSGNCRLDQLPSGHPLLTQIARDLDQRTGEQIARHRHLL
jgi:hypothetical protein